MSDSFPQKWATLDEESSGQLHRHVDALLGYDVKRSTIEFGVGHLIEIRSVTPVRGEDDADCGYLVGGLLSSNLDSEVDVEPVFVGLMLPLYRLAWLSVPNALWVALADTFRVAYTDPVADQHVREEQPYEFAMLREAMEQCVDGTKAPDWMEHQRGLEWLVNGVYVVQVEGFSGEYIGDPSRDAGFALTYAEMQYDLYLESLGMA